MKKWSSNGYTDATFKLTKYQHLELILRGNKLNIQGSFNVTDSGTKIGFELAEEKNQMCPKNGRHYLGLCTSMSNRR